MLINFLSISNCAVSLRILLSSNSGFVLSEATLERTCVAKRSLRNEEPQVSPVEYQRMIL